MFTDLDDKGMGENFTILKGALRTLILERFDHTHLNELEPFTRQDPTAENLAKAFFLILKEHYNPGPNGAIHRVEVWEGEDSCAAYEIAPA
jgi:6-pyruvoyltetrahydropterin/6-carboxytetrahydropterin synthase